MRMNFKLLNSSEVEITLNNESQGCIRPKKTTVFL